MQQGETRYFENNVTEKAYSYTYGYSETPPKGHL